MRESSPVTRCVDILILPLKRSLHKILVVVIIFSLGIRQDEGKKDAYAIAKKLLKLGLLDKNNYQSGTTFDN